MDDVSQGLIRVAVLDDDAFFCGFVATLIDQNSHAAVFAAASGDGLCEIIDREPIDCIVMDYDLGEDDGFSVTRRLRARYETLPPIVMLTSDETQTTAVEAFRLGIRDYLAKPNMKPDALMSTIERAMRNDHRDKQIAAEHRQLAALATQDSLTGLANRRAFDDVLLREFKRAARESTSLSLIMVDVDGFKLFNDRYGHPAGDQCLRRIGGTIHASLHRPGDVAARYGGEEFAVILPATDEAGAAVVAERIRRTVAELAWTSFAGAHFRVTISAGAAGVDPLAGDTDIEALLRDADDALYFAKGAGRNACVRASTLHLQQQRRPSAAIEVDAA